MMFPDDKEKFEEWCYANDTGPDDEFVRQSVREILAGHRENIPDPHEFASFRITKRHAGDLFKKGLAQGLRAGEILCTLKKIFDHPKRIRGREPSLHQAYAVTAKKLQLSPRSMRSAWEELRPVAHLWAAHCILIHAEGFQPGKIWSQRFVRLTLIISEALLDFSENHSTGPLNKSTPILSRDEAWDLPKGFAINKDWMGLAASVVAALPPLTDTEIKTLRHYRAANRQ